MSAAELLHLRPYLDRPGRLCEAWLRSRALQCIGQRQPLTDWLLPGWRPETPEPDHVDERGWRPYPEDVAPADRTAMVAAAVGFSDTHFAPFNMARVTLAAAAGFFFASLPLTTAAQQYSSLYGLSSA